MKKNDLRTTVKRGQAVMTFQQIAIAMGYPPTRRSAKTVTMIYLNAMKKIRRNIEEVNKLKELSDLRKNGCY